ncbi:MAG: tRNA 2-thiocytidine biosynthesis protein TtcA [Desulfofustis sp. PB-SRB1]|jgi:tRNA 2-thiocytidine biosynthesis protein TtcA|nr:tRNA 2-thiocytidine biosynthesis protein TtcA [Desulfofustis sp. PB-SRB1]MBM1001742.1 tRNA 2-thiocytidine biosynthesis protein TtcA [Desulfofustis sp. PB-SRB1]HBH29374.1 tRNA 2-thiocytidine biosynthesis protein TtcA [Desulfofustis sp.]HBH32307.1 tRNA 2-thiocytidine biosynthesis protein TtcA [Desulfofustis sp.]
MATQRMSDRLRRNIGRALSDWDMLADGDLVVIGVSGGIDSLVNAWALNRWREKAPIHYDLCPVFVDIMSEYDAGYVARLTDILSSLGLPLEVIPGISRSPETGDNCYTCARNRRTQLFQFARMRGATKLSFGHHQDDIIETFFLNALYSGNISTMRPRQDLFGGTLSIIRPLSYLSKEEIDELAVHIGISPMESICPAQGDTCRKKVRSILAHIYQQLPHARRSLFNALGNVRTDYLLIRD